MRNIWEKLENRRKNKWAGGPCHAWAVPCRHATVNVPCRASPRAEASAQTRHGITGRAGTAHRLACRAGPGPATVLPCSGRPGLARPIWPGITTCESLIAEVDPTFDINRWMNRSNSQKISRFDELMFFILISIDNREKKNICPN